LTPFKHFAVVLLAAAVAVPLGLPAQAADRTADGEGAFAARCAKCHTVDKLAPSLARRKPDARLAYLERFLARYYAPDATERKMLAAWLSEAAGTK
jgi:mono/diheme cytochrome c family protein